MAARAVDRVRVRSWVLDVLAVISAACEVVTTLELGLVEQVFQSWVGQWVLILSSVSGVISVSSTCTAEISVRVVEAGIDDGHVHTLTRLAGLSPGIDSAHKIIRILIRWAFWATRNACTLHIRVAHGCCRVLRQRNHTQNLRRVLSKLYQSVGISFNGQAGNGVAGGELNLRLWVELLELCFDTICCAGSLACSCLSFLICALFLVTLKAHSAVELLSLLFQARLFNKLNEGESAALSLGNLLGNIASLVRKLCQRFLGATLCSCWRLGSRLCCQSGTRKSSEHRGGGENCYCSCC